MFNNLKMVGIVAVLGFIAYSVFLKGPSVQTADLGQVLDRTEFAINKYQNYLGSQGVDGASDTQLQEFSLYLAHTLNTDPRFYDKPLGIAVEPDGKFLGFADDNANDVQDSDEADVFTVEVDEANRRLIATDVAGNSSGMHFSSTGFLAGALIGTLLNRQRGAGITPSSFNNRTVTPRASYRAPSSARSGGLRLGK